MAKNDFFFPLKNVSNDYQQNNGKVFPGIHYKNFAILA